MSRLLKSALPVIAVLALSPLAATALAHQPVAHAAGHCSVGSGVNKWGYTYIYPLTTTHVGCGTADKVAKKHGKVHGWHCSTKRLQTSSIQYTSRTTCKSGRRKVVWVYSQNT
jgi:hypothetical protein